jgi:hypothetical protein
MNMSPFLTVSRTCDQTLPQVIQELHQAGLRSVQTFDLHIARAAVHDCSCPHHGTDQCDCQMLVLLVYGSTTEPVTLILHGNNGQTWLSIPNRTASNATLASQIQNSLQTGSLSVVK